MLVGRQPAVGIAGIKLVCDGQCDDVLELALRRYEAIISGPTRNAPVGFLVEPAPTSNVATLVVRCGFQPVVPLHPQLVTPP